jgi:hypothetical protein
LSGRPDKDRPAVRGIEATFPVAGLDRGDCSARFEQTGGPEFISIIPNNGSLPLAKATLHTASKQLTFPTKQRGSS